MELVASQSDAFMRRSTKKQSDISLTFTVASALSDMFFHRACSSHISKFHVASMLIRFFVQPWYLGCIFRNRGPL